MKAALRVAPEPASLPDELEGAPLPELAAARNRMIEVAQAARSVRLAIDEALAQRLGPNGALRYGQRLLRPATGGYQLLDTAAFWRMFHDALGELDAEDRVRLVQALWNAGDAKLSGLKLLAIAIDRDPKAVRSTLVGRKAPSGAIWSTSPRYWPGWARDLAEGEALVTAATWPTEEEILAWLEQGPQDDDQPDHEEADAH